jgi:hypothetical protein
LGSVRPSPATAHPDDENLSRRDRNRANDPFPGAIATRDRWIRSEFTATAAGCFDPRGVDSLGHGYLLDTAGVLDDNRIESSVLEFPSAGGSGVGGDARQQAHQNHGHMDPGRHSLHCSLHI